MKNLFSSEELTSSTIGGSSGFAQLDIQKMHWVKEWVFTKVPLVAEETLKVAWGGRRGVCNSIDNGLRYLKKTKINKLNKYD